MHDHHHEHDTDNKQIPANFGRAFAIGIAANLTYVGVQVVYGLLAHSMALLADAAHNFGDVLALVLAWAASVLSRRVPTGRFTYGLRKTSVLAALANAGFLLIVTGGIAWEALQRLLHPMPVAGATVAWVAALGILINGGTALLFMAGRERDLNISAAFTHLASDAVVSVGVALAGIGILYTGWLRLDPIVSLIVSAVIVAGTWGLLRDSVRLSLDAVPSGIDVDQVKSHLVMPGGHPGDQFLTQLCHELHDLYRIDHATVQVEVDANHRCALAPAHVV